jgi:putative Mg2+ transporter-C (MgtC) family protein
MQVISGVLTGIGFLGAGAIIRSRDSAQVIGTATGASIWASGGMGLALGFGFYMLALISFVTIFSVLFLFGLVMQDRHDGPQSDD